MLVHIHIERYKRAGVTGRGRRHFMKEQLRESLSKIRHEKTGEKIEKAQEKPDPDADYVDDDEDYGYDEEDDGDIISDSEDKELV